MGNKRFKIQSLVFDKKFFFNKSNVRTWIKDNGFKIDKRLKQPIMKFSRSFRVRQRNPDWFDKKTFKQQNIIRGVKGVFGLIKK